MQAVPSSFAQMVANFSRRDVFYGEQESNPYPQTFPFLKTESGAATSSSGCAALAYPWGRPK